MTPETPGFSGNTLDRADHLRADPQALADLLCHNGARWLHMQGFDPVLTEDGALDWSTAPATDARADAILLGLVDGAPCFVVLENQTIEAPLFRSPRVMQVLATLGPAEMAIYGTARSLIDWHGKHRFCGKCGAPTSVQRAGWGRRCGGCAAEHFPRVDPVVIMVAEHAGRALVGRQASWPEGRYSALAGFLEPGETMEEAVARELFEEAGVRATQVRYVTSQPWPFPAQLMLACIAQVDSDALTIATDELEGAIWVTRDEVLAALAGAPDAKFLAPPAYAVAHSLLKHWALR
ncbi:NAD(+) diphosphatase [Rhodoferax lacus]|uniref:NAD(+) diphosphatase n=1 Tax=Rhodoferax lacus TaxID=2184758 RepID=A0A3E1RHT5_9BURK|nr:NAD(+) diphosphatase [Rhodoferax lacus]RFO98966.1 NAD(+) diphosphatase [Rhodoferax lacus]